MDTAFKIFLPIFGLWISGKNLASCCSSNVDNPTEVILSDGDIKYITTPNYPYNYPAYSTCYWRVRAPINRKISYAFSDDFDLNGFFCLSTDDYVKLYDGPNNWGNAIGKYCGKGAPPAHTIKRNYLFVEFKSGFANGDKGFKLAVAEGFSPYAPPDYPPEASFSNSVVGITVISVILLAIAGCIVGCVYCCCRQTGRRGNVISQFGPTTTSTGNPGLVPPPQSNPAPQYVHSAPQPTPYLEKQSAYPPPYYGAYSAAPPYPGPPVGPQGASAPPPPYPL